jgi:hypothetical protein
MDEGSCLFQVMNFQWLDMYSCSEMENQAEAQSLKILMNKWSFLYVSVLFLLKDVVLVARFETGRDGFGSEYVSIRKWMGSFRYS